MEFVWLATNRNNKSTGQGMLDGRVGPVMASTWENRSQQCGVAVCTMVPKYCLSQSPITSALSHPQMPRVE